MHLDESSQFGLQLRHAGEYATVQGTTFQLSKPTFNGIQPRRTGGCEVKVDARVCFEPLAYSWRFVSAQVVQDDMEVFACAEAPIQEFKEGQELLAIGLIGDLADDFACERIFSAV